MRQIILKIIKDKIKEYHKNLDTDSEAFNDKRPNNFIDECLKLSIEEQCFSEEELINESLTMLVGVSVYYYKYVSTILNICIGFRDHRYNRILYSAHACNVPEVPTASIRRDPRNFPTTVEQCSG